MSDCCTPLDVGQNKEVCANGESCCAPTLTGNREKVIAAQANRCPACDQKGKKVDSITLKSMLNVSLLALRDVPYLFCRTADCPVVYFAADGEQTFTTGQIRVPVHQKEPGDETVPVCYCFGHNPFSIQAELSATGRSTVVEEINRGIKAGQCACEIRNPQGSCCLGNVSAAIQRVAQTLTTPV